MTPERLIIEPSRANKILGFTGNVEIPLNDIVLVSIDKGLMGQTGVWKGGGTGVPGAYTGVFYKGDVTDFVLYHEGQIPLQFDIRKGSWVGYSQVVVGVDDPQALIDQIKQQRPGLPVGPPQIAGIEEKLKKLQAKPLSSADVTATVVKPELTEAEKKLNQRFKVSLYLGLILVVVGGVLGALAGKSLLVPLAIVLELVGIFSVGLAIYFNFQAGKTGK